MEWDSLLTRLHERVDGLGDSTGLQNADALDKRIRQCTDRLSPARA